MSFWKSAKICALSAVLLSGASAAEAAVVISTQPTRAVVCTAGVCTARTVNAVLNVSDLTAMLASGDATLICVNNAHDILVNAALAWGSTGKLTLQAQGTVTIQQPVTAQGTSGLAIATSGGNLYFVGRGKIEFWDLTSTLTIDGASYRLENDLAMLASDIAAHPGDRYALAKSLTLTGYTAPVSTAFGGTFEGLGNTLSRLRIVSNLSGNVGLFDNVSGSLRDIKLVNASVKDLKSGVHLGALAGQSTGTISGASVTGAVAAGQNAFVGGLAGVSSGTVTNSSAAVAVTAMSGNVGGLLGSASGSILHSSASGSVTTNGDNVTTNAGGLVGGFGGGTLQYSFASGNVSATGTGASSVVLAGGLAGAIGAGTIQYDHASGTVTGTATGAHVGGFVGEGGGIDQSYATGNVSANGTGTSCGSWGASAYAGGFVGLGDGITNVYATGSVSGTANNGHSCLATIGGIAGSSDGVSMSYATGALTGSAQDCVGGVIGNSDHGLSDTYWDTDTTGASAGVGPGCGLANGTTGLTTSQLQSALPAGFLSPPWTRDPNGVTNGGLPYLSALPPA